MLTLLALAAGVASGWFGHKYRDRFTRVKTGVKKVLDDEMRK